MNQCLLRLGLAAGAMLLAILPQAVAQGQAAIPPDADYVTVSPDGHLQLQGQRVRYWGWIGHFNLEGKLAELRVKPGDSAQVKAQKVAKTREVYDALAQRISDLGFNLVRWWGIGDWTNANYTPGDGSDADLAAFALAALE